MPQLNPNPWFFTMLISWLSFLVILQPKLLTFTSTNQPSPKITPTMKPTPWNWPWT